MTDSKRPSVPRVGDPALPSHGEGCCGYSHRDGYGCTLEHGHAGPVHVACGVQRVLAVWPVGKGSPDA